jgi:hypothetical protein
MRFGMKDRSTLRFLRALTISTAIGLGCLFAVSTAHAGEVKFGEGPMSLATGDDGKLTDAGRKTAVTALDKVAGEDEWDLRIYAKLDKGAGGPLYVEFWQTVEVLGKKQVSKVFHHEDPNYEGGKYVAYNIVLEGKVGFNKDRTYNVYFVQVGKNDKDIRLASSKLELINTGREPEKGEDTGDGAEEEEASDQDALDSLGGPDEEEEEEPDAPAEAPPETEASKKGCAVDGGIGFNGALMLLLLGGTVLSRRRD